MANVKIKISPENLVKWSNFEDWENGTSSAPTEHTLSGGSATIAREATIVNQGTYSAAVTRVGNDADLYHDFPDYLDWVGTKMTFGMWVYATVASRARIAIDDGVNAQENSSYHTGGSSWEFLTVTLDTSVSATQIRIICEVNTGNTTAYFDGGLLCQGDASEVVLTDIADIGEFKPTNRYRGQSSKVTRRDGSEIPNILLESKTLKIGGMIAGSTPTTARNSLDDIVKAVNSPRLKPDFTREKKDLYLFDDRFYRGFVDSLNIDSRAALKVRDFDFRFIIPEPYEQYVQYLRTAQAISSDPTTFTVTTNGNVFVRPIITITNDSSTVSSITVENITTQQSFAFAGSVVTGNSLVVDTEKVTVENNGVGDLANSTGDYFEFVLYPGANEIKIDGIVSGTIKVDWRDRWYS